MLPVRITALAPGLYSFAFTPTAEEVGLDPEAFREIHVDGHLDVAATQFIAHLTTSALARLTCDRTLVEFEQPVEGKHLVVFTTDPELADGSDDDVQYVAHEAPFVDLAGPVHDTLLLALPVRALAPGAEDIELPTQFGGSDIDPRWETLLRLRDPDSH